MGGEVPLPPPSTLTPNVYLTPKSDMVGRINDREHMTLARTNKTPALQAIVEVKSSVTV